MSASRHIYAVICILLLLPAVALAQSPDQPAGGAAFRFARTIHDFGRIPTDTVVEHRFEFVNSGDAMLIINDIALSCPCFTVDWSRGPVMPGDKGWVSVQYPSAEKAGAFEKLIWIASNAINTPADLGRYELRIKGAVVARRPAAPAPAPRQRRR